MDRDSGGGEPAPDIQGRLFEGSRVLEGAGKTLPQLVAESGPFEIVVGVNTKNVETTIIHVLNVVSEGLQQFYFDRKALVVVADGFSDDATVRLAEFYPGPRRIVKAVVRQLGGPGKGNGVRTILEIGRLAQAHAVAFFDGDLVSVRPIWVDNLVRPLMHGLADLVVPYYLRDKWDGVITNHLVYPFTAALYGTSVRQPIGGEYGLSRRYYERLLQGPMPEHFGIDIFLTTTALAEGYRVIEAPLGVKVHASATAYTEPKRTLSRMYLEVVGTMLDLARRYEEKWRDDRLSPHVFQVENVIPYYDRLPPPTKITVETVRAAYQEGLDKHDAVLRAVLEPELHRAVRVARDTGLARDVWVNCAYALAARCMTGQEGPEREELLHAIGALGMGRFLRFVDRTRDMDLNQAHEVIREQAELFQKLRPEFVRRVDALRSASAPVEQRRPGRN